MLSVFGGKITTYRRLAEAALAKLAPHFPQMRGAWTATASLPGGDFPWDGAPALAAALRRGFPFLDGSLARRLVRQLRHPRRRGAGRCRAAWPISARISAPG